MFSFVFSFVAYLGSLFRLAAQVEEQGGGGGESRSVDLHEPALEGGALDLDADPARLFHLGSLRVSTSEEHAPSLCRLVALGASPHHVAPVPGGASYRGFCGPLSGDLLAPGNDIYGERACRLVR